jgi:transposase
MLAQREAGWSEAQEGVEVKCVAGPEGNETFVLCRSKDRAQKEKAMHERFATRIQKALEKLAGRLERARKKVDPGSVERQIGRLLGRNSRAAAAFEIQVQEAPERGSGLKLSYTRNASWSEWSALSEGHYLLRTNLVGWTAQDLWKTYIQLTQAEAAFRTHKSELQVRPIWHHLQGRVQAHILFSFLAYAMWKTLEQWMVRSGLGNAPRQVIEEIARIKVVDVFLPTSTGQQLRLQCITRPDQAQQILLQRLGLQVPRRLGRPRWEKFIEKM